MWQPADFVKFLEVAYDRKAKFGVHLSLASFEQSKLVFKETQEKIATADS